MPSRSSRRGLVLSAILVLLVLAGLDLMRHDSLLRAWVGWVGPERGPPGLERLERSRLPVSVPRRP